MNSANQIKRCKKCGIYYIYTKNSKLAAEIHHCHDCRGDKFSGTAVLFAKVIEKMMRD